MRRRQTLASLILLALVAAACSQAATTTTAALPEIPTPSATVTTTTTTTPVSTAPTSTVGAAGIGDEYYPMLGNGGYDVDHYDLDLFYDPDDNMLDAAVIITAIATQDLTTFNLDFTGFDIVDLRVGDLPATFERNGGELTITPDVPIASGERFDITIAYAGNPTAASSPAFDRVAIGWREGPEGEQYIVAEPDAAHTWFPSNDHPLDKATFSFLVTVPDEYAVGATGEFLGIEPGHQIGETLSYLWEMSTPMAPYLATIVIGEGYQLIENPVSTKAAGIPVRNFLPADLVATPPDSLEDTGEMLSVLEEAFGPYPFDRYGITVVGGFPAALENQTFSVFGRVIVDAPFFEFVLVHELAHQWFGNSVSVAQWSDIWLNEGFATYSELLWIEHRQGRAVYDQVVASRRRAATTAEYPPPGLPPPTDLFNGGVYQLGGLLLADLRDEIGDDAFFTLLRTYAADFADGNATTEDFIALAEDISGQNLEEFFQVRLFEPL